MQVELPEIGNKFLRVTLEFDMVKTEENQMGITIDISSYNGDIDFNTLFSENDIDRVIHRATIKNGSLDPNIILNINKMLAYSGTKPELDVYKFSYSRTAKDSFNETINTINKLKDKAVFNMITTYWLDLEAWDNRDYTAEECWQVILGAKEACNLMGIRFGIYCPYSYLLYKKIPTNFKYMPVWVARWANELNNSTSFTPELWQYTSKGTLSGISGNVDISKEV